MLDDRLITDVNPIETTMPARLLWRERIVHGCLALCAAVPTIGISIIFVVFVYQTVLFFQDVPVSAFLFDRQWTPLFSTRQFGIGVLVSATFLITAIALLVAIPLGTLSAVYLAEYAPPWLRKALKPFLEALSGVPTVVYGYFALHFLTPSLKQVIPTLSGFNSLSAGLVTGFLIIPIISSLSEDAIRNVPRVLREGAYAAGLTQFETILKVVLPAALPSIIASYTLATSRALGETMIAAIAAGQNPVFTANPLVPVESMTAFIVQVSLGDVPEDSLAFHTIFAVGLVLFFITLSLNHLGQVMGRRYSSLTKSLVVPKAESNPLSAKASLSSQQNIQQAMLTDESSDTIALSRRFKSSHCLPEYSQDGLFHPRPQRRIWINRGIWALGAVAACIGLVIFATLLFGTFQEGLSRINWQFLTSSPSRKAENAGILNAIVGTIWLMLAPAVLVVPIGVGAAVYLEEYLPKGRISHFLELTIANAAAVPSILYGILGLALVVRRMEPLTGGRSILSAALVMAIIALPVFIIAVQTALRTVSDDLCDAAYAIGMTRSQMIWFVTLPYAFPGIITAMLLAMSRIIGETAAVLAIGALAFVTSLPSFSLEGLHSSFTTLPTQIFFWAVRPQQAFQVNAAAAIIVLGVFVLAVNVIAVVIRDLYRRQS